MLRRRREFRPRDARGVALRDIAELPGRGRVTVDTAPIVYVLEDHPEMGPRYAGFFDRAQASHYQLTISTITLAEVLTPS